MIEKMKIKVLDEKCVPVVGTSGSAGFDLAIRERAIIHPHKTAKIGCGICFQIPPGYVGKIEPRSSTFNKGLEISGVIDSDYRGEASIVMCNTTNQSIVVDKYSFPAQLLILKKETPDLVIVDELDETERGDKGFGSTGRNA